jgi:hypothetical protein
MSSCNRRAFMAQFVIGSTAVAALAMTGARADTPTAAALDARISYRLPTVRPAPVDSMVDSSYRTRAHVRSLRRVRRKPEPHGEQAVKGDNLCRASDLRRDRYDRNDRRSVLNER